MKAFANTPASGSLLTPRNLILAALVIFMLSILGMFWTMLQPQDSGGAGGDTYGTRRHGFRALFEILTESGVTVRRELAPPQAETSDVHTLALLRPNARLVGGAPKYVQALLAWVEGGGRLVVALPPERFGFGSAPNSGFGGLGLSPPADILELLGVNDRIQQSETFLEGTSNNTTSGSTGGRSGPFDWWQPPDDTPAQQLAATSTGSLAPLSIDITRLAVPGDSVATLKGDASKLDGSLTVRDSDGDDHILVAAFARGAGQIVIVSDPRLVANNLIANADNSVLAARLLAPEGNDVVFDEFYHGLAVRGNPFYLLTRPGFAAIALGILLGVGVWTWRQAVFLGPPLEDPPPSRRDIGEYVDAMGDFFCRGAGHRSFLAREVRDGVLHQLCQELKLPPDKLDVQEITTLLARRDPRRAAALRQLFAEIDEELRSTRDYASTSFLPTMHRLTAMSR